MTFILGVVTNNGIVLVSDRRFLNERDGRSHGPKLFNDPELPSVVYGFSGSEFYFHDFREILAEELLEDSQ